MQLTSLLPVSHSGQLIISYRRLLWHAALNEIRARYSGSLIGGAWAILNPIIMMTIYAVLYLVILQIKVEDLTAEQYVLFIFSGLIPILMTSEAISTGISSLSASKSIWMNTVFPIDLIPIKAVILSQITIITGYIIIIIAMAVLGLLNWMMIFIPVIWFFHVIFLMGINWILSLISLVFRDLQILIGPILMILIIASPIAYLPKMVPVNMSFFITLNPFAYFVRAYHIIVIFGEFPETGVIIPIVLMSLITFYFGGWFFYRTKGVFIDYV